ncbi:thioredoxin domain-containing protein [Bacillaceae bacterium IKA-2]|nr:thioredoxin domain-containing protein [Bacillaceae bacterium IKA-2]
MVSHERKRAISLVLILVAVAAILIFKDKGTPNDESSALDVTGDTVLLFSANACPSCIEMKKRVNQLESEYEETISFLTVNVNSRDNQELIQKFNVRMIPTTVFIDKNGKEVKNQVGLLPLDYIRNEIDNMVDGGSMDD